MIPFIDLAAQQQRIKTDIDQRIAAVLAHGQYILGPEVPELEAELVAFTGARHCVGVSDGTTALQIALMALGVGPGDEVITTPFSFIATAEVIALLGAIPVFVDIDPRTCNIDPARIETAITAKTRAIIPVSLYGQCADMDAINGVAARFGLAVIEDAAQSFGATYKGRHSCALSTIACTSFFPSKPLGCYGDGGACFTDDDELATRMREIRAHGQDRRYHHPRVGLNGRLDTLQAAILLAKLKIFPEEVARRAAIGARYSEQLGDIAATPHIEAWNTSVYAQYTLRVPNREALVKALAGKGVPTAVHYPIPLHRQPALAGISRWTDCTGSERAAAEVMSLPMHPWLSQEDQDRVCEAVKSCL
ncbi:MAG: DegT/DnrJ/EryC1/StrS aminotransferase [Moraxellaceae bacterium]|nr:DegT/DnrJ/EryC1/StrS aminotransferase [Moraxellaceae bacterium]